MTAGMKSSEFWLNAVMILAAIFGKKFGVEVPLEAFIGSGGYAIARGITKSSS